MVDRISSRTIAMGSLANLQASQARSAKLQEQLSSGKTLTKPSDDPVAANNAMTYRNELGVQEQYAKANLDGQGWLSVQDTAMQSAVDAMQRARDLAVQAGNTGALDANSLRAIGQEMGAVNQIVLAAANTKFLGHSVFAGAKGSADTAGAYDKTTFAYQGDTTAITRRVAPGLDVQVNVTGSETFGGGTTPADNTFVLLDTLSKQLMGTLPAGTTPVADPLTAIDAAFQRLMDARAKVGATTNQLQALSTSGDTRTDQLTASLSDIEDIDLPKTIIDVKLQDNAYQAALSATAKIIQPTLMDFLR
ncbi:flagellar hook-associated protein FlgL [Kineococcus gynurae]|uniref:Flagellar hook-associated protein FlgL n=1 Tax=Kineococcus gynurae TaxID=452979 RepID=A0ABV5LXG2_9ACTN